MKEAEPPAPDPSPPEAPAEPEKVEGYQTFYDDERDSAPKKQGLSDDMKKRLLKEQRGLGADANSKNPFLFVFAGVGVFVLLGALAVSM
ncbi:MAG: hypothetical protein SGPRY_009711 [Prymnesium sp.]